MPPVANSAGSMGFSKGDGAEICRLDLMRPSSAIRSSDRRIEAHEIRDCAERAVRGTVPATQRSSGDSRD